jgi:hypothetical protein
MKKKRTAEQNVGKLREAERELARGRTIAEVVRKLGITEQTCYRGRKEYSGPHGSLESISLIMVKTACSRFGDPVVGLRGKPGLPRNHRSPPPALRVVGGGTIAKGQRALRT